MIDLLGLNPHTDPDHSDKHNIEDIPKGKDFIWSKPQKVCAIFNDIPWQYASIFADFLRKENLYAIE